VDVEHTTATDSEGEVAVERYRPPFVLTSDMLLLVALARTMDLRRGFPEVPFLSILGRTPLVVWFSRITESCYHDQRREWCCERTSLAEGIYDELNVLVVLRRRAVFVPVIYASEARTVQIGQHYYGMPKQLAEPRVRVGEGRFEATLAGRGGCSFVEARLLGGGTQLGRGVSRLWPRWTWPVHFPGGGQVRALILATPRIQIAVIRAGQLGMVAPWLPNARGFLPVGLSVRGLRLQLPPSAGSPPLGGAAQRRPP
jgi:hypothetical protein